MSPDQKLPSLYLEFPTRKILSVTTKAGHTGRFFPCYLSQCVEAMMEILIGESSCSKYTSEQFCWDVISNGLMFRLGNIWSSSF